MSNVLFASRASADLAKLDRGTRLRITAAIYRLISGRQADVKKLQ